MPLDVDYVAGNQAIDELKVLLSQQPYGEREEIADEICAFVAEMKQKYG
jgi:hypothetical protein